jgi:hypothetical protein
MFTLLVFMAADRVVNLAMVLVFWAVACVSMELMNKGA